MEEIIEPTSDISIMEEIPVEVKITPEPPLAKEILLEDEFEEELIIEDFTIDGICGVY